MFPLIRHPHAPSHALQAVSAQATRTKDGKLALSYSLSGDLARLRVPAPGPARIGWKPLAPHVLRSVHRAQRAPATTSSIFRPRANGPRTRSRAIARARHFTMKR